MSNPFNYSKKRLSKMEHGQVLLVVAVSIVVLVAIVGLSLDVGIMFIDNARMKRAVDAAALAAALQFRQGATFVDMDRSASDFLRLNGFDNGNAIVQICFNPTDPPSNVEPPDADHTIPAELCPTADQLGRKLVRVVAAGNVSLAFLPVIGIHSVPIAAQSISETASVDVVLVLDRSESMTWTANSPLTPPYSPMRDPSVCNNPSDPLFDPNFAAGDPYDASYTGYCRPFDEVKKAAVSFVNQLYFPYDRVSVVTFDKRPHVVLELSNDKDSIISSIKTLTVFQGEVSPGDPTGINSIYSNDSASPLPSRYYDSDGMYWGLQCSQSDEAIHTLHPEAFPDYPSPAPCTTTNIGAGMYDAGMRFTNGIANPFRNNSLWVVILLTDGVPNAGYTVNSGVIQYYCPGGPGTGGAGQPANTWEHTDIPPICNDGVSGIDGDTSTRHKPSTSPYYDAADYAYDAADFVASSQNALLFSIGLGAKVTQLSDPGEGGDNTALGENYLRYAADHACDPTDLTAKCPGTYSPSPTPADLVEVFRAIAQNIATRLTH